MILTVTTRIDRDRDEETVETFDAPTLTFAIEPSGALVVLRSQSDVWAAYAPGQWLKVRED